MNYKQLTNKHMALFFFMLSFIFFMIGAYNSYTWNFIAGFYFFILSIGFKTWELINYAREEVEALWIITRKKK